MSDIYQNDPKPFERVIKRYMSLIEDAFDGNSDVVMIPSGPKGLKSRLDGIETTPCTNSK